MNLTAARVLRVFGGAFAANLLGWGVTAVYAWLFSKIYSGSGDGAQCWYTLHVRPIWYFDWWTRDITHQVHLRVMWHIKNLSEDPR